MLKFIRNLFSKSKKTESLHLNKFTPDEFEMDDNLKSKGLEAVLGKMHNLVGHAIIPFSIGGTVDMYYFPNHIKGVAFATMELLEPNGSGPLPNNLGTYELVAFTKYEYDNVDESPFGLIERKICGVFTNIGNYSKEAVLNPHAACELPNGDGEENTFIVLDLYEPNSHKFKVGEREHHLLLCVLVFGVEMDFAKEYGTPALLEKLKAARHYPYSDLQREPVV